MIQTHANLFLFLGNKSEAACYRAPAVALEFAHRNFWPVAYVSVNFSQEVAVVNILVHLLKRWKFVVELISPKGLRCLVAISMYPVVGHGTSVSLFHDHIATMDGYMDGCTLTSKHYHHPSNPALISTPWFIHHFGKLRKPHWHPGADTALGPPPGRPAAAGWGLCFWAKT